jgi:hypothetical protein
LNIFPYFFSFAKETKTLSLITAHATALLVELEDGVVLGLVALECPEHLLFLLDQPLKHKIT